MSHSFSVFFIVTFRWELIIIQHWSEHAIFCIEFLHTYSPYYFTVLTLVAFAVCSDLERQGCATFGTCSPRPALVAAGVANLSQSCANRLFHMNLVWSRYVLPLWSEEARLAFSEQCYLIWCFVFVMGLVVTRSMFCTYRLRLDLITMWSVITLAINFVITARYTYLMWLDKKGRLQLVI